MGCTAEFMDIDVPTEAGPTEETVDALIDYLVGPLLPLKHAYIADETLPESKHKPVAKQVHAAVVLYNYYHLKQHPESKFLKFDQFCNLAIMFKPNILLYMKYMRETYRAVLNDLENQLSLTEKAIMDACTVSETLLKVSADISNIIKGWKVTKVAVLLVDSKKENCFLQFNYGLWSLIEKELRPESKKGKKMMTQDDEEREIGFRNLAFAAVQEVAGTANSELKVLESRVVYSLSDANTATHFYVVQNTQSMSEDHLVPIQDVISSLQGPVVKKCSGSWVITPVVEYYYLLPYAEVISKLFSRVMDSLPHQVKADKPHVKIIQAAPKSCEMKSGESKEVCGNLHKKPKLDADDVITSQFIGTPVDQKVKEAENSTGNSATIPSTEGMKQKDMNGSCRAESNNASSGGDNNIGIDKPLDSAEKENQNSRFQVPLKVYRHERKSTASNSVNKENQKDLKKKSTVGQSKDERVDGEKSLCFANEDRSLAVNHILDDFDSTVDAKKSELSDAALRALVHKRQKLYDQRSVVEGELTLCEKKIQTIMHGGVGDCLGLKLEAVIDCCNEICNRDAMQTQNHTNLQVSRTFPLLPGKSLSEAQLTLEKACQELDEICLSNNWMLPTYHTSRLDGGFVANVTLKEPSFEFSGASGVQPSIHEARNSAATVIITRLLQLGNGKNAALP